jgi:hypothetical protein
MGGYEIRCFETGSGAMIYISSFIKIDIQKLMGGGGTQTHSMVIAQAYFLKIRKVGL